MCLVDALYHLTKKMPVIDIEFYVSDGNPFYWYFCNFMAFFHVVVKNRIGESRERLVRLLKYTSGDAKEIIKLCVWKPPTIRYQNTKKILLQKHGNLYHVIVGYRKQMKPRPMT